MTSPYWQMVKDRNFDEVPDTYLDWCRDQPWIRPDTLHDINKEREARKKEERERKEKEEAERKAALAPDREKIIAYGFSLTSLPTPDLSDKKAQRIVKQFYDRLQDAVNDMNNSAEAL